MKILTQETFQIIKLNWRNLFVFEFLYRLITGPLYLKIASVCMKWALKMAGYSYLTLGNFGAFLIKPWSVICLLAVSIIGILFLFIEMGSLVSSFSAAVYFQKLNPIEMFWGGINKLVDEVRRKNIQLAGILIANYVLINFYIGIFILTQIRPFNMLTNNLLELGWFKCLAIVALVLCMGAILYTLFVFQGCMIEQKRFVDAVARSKQLLKGRYLKSTVLLVGYIFCFSVIILILYVLSLFIITVWVVLFVDNRMELAFLIGFNERMRVWFIFIASIGSGILYFAATTVQYYQYQSGINYESRKNLFYSKSTNLAKRNLKRVIMVIAILSAFCLFDTFYNGNHLGSFVAVKIAITAHRGSSKKAPENTIPAIQAAIDEMADYAEIDVQETKDGEIVIFHDSTLRRIAGLNRTIASMTWQEVSQVDAGKWFADEFEGAAIPKLEEVMELCKGKISLNIELKNMGDRSQLPEKTLELINQYEMANQCVITSTNLKYLRRIKVLQPDIKTGYILSAAIGNYYSDEAIDFISIRSGFVNEKVIKSTHESGKTVHAWTVNSKSEMERLKMLGVDNIITDYPLLAREIVFQEKATQNLLGYMRILLR